MSKCHTLLFLRHIIQGELFRSLLEEIRKEDLDELVYFKNLIRGKEFLVELVLL